MSNSRLGRREGGTEGGREGGRERRGSEGGEEEQWYKDYLSFFEIVSNL